MVDPDKDMCAEVPGRVRFDLSEHLTTGTVITLVRTLQGMGSLLDQQMDGQDWRMLVCNMIFEDTTRHTQERTGSQTESEFLKANDLPPQILGARNA